MSEIPEVFAIFEQKLAHVLSFNLRQKGQKKAIEELLVYFSGIVGRASKAEARIAELEEKQRWIPVSERLPEIINGMEYYDAVVEGEEFVEIALWDGWHKTWNLYDGGDSYSCTTFVTHWRERPTLPEVYGKEREE